MMTPEIEYFPEEMPAFAAQKLLTGIVVPRPIALVTTLSPGGAVNAAPFSMFTVVSAAPPCVLVAILDRKGGRKDTLANLERTGEFGIGFVTLELARAAAAAAADLPPETSELAVAGLTPAPSARIRTPGIAESPVRLECRVQEARRPEWSLQATLVVGRVVRVAASGTEALEELALVGHGGGDDFPFRFLAPGWEFTLSPFAADARGIAPRKWAGFPGARTPGSPD